MKWHFIAKNLFQTIERTFSRLNAQHVSSRCFVHITWMHSLFLRMFTVQFHVLCVYVCVGDNFENGTEHLVILNFSKCSMFIEWRSIAFGMNSARSTLLLLCRLFVRTKDLTASTMMKMYRRQHSMYRRRRIWLRSDLCIHYFDRKLHYVPMNIGPFQLLRTPIILSV